VDSACSPRQIHKICGRVVWEPFERLHNDCLCFTPQRPTGRFVPRARSPVQLPGPSARFRSGATKHQ
jgi:hypothetical protein